MQLCDVWYIYTHMWMSLYLISSSLLLSYLFLSIIIYVYTYATSASSATPIVNNCTVGKSIAFLTCNCFWSLGFWSLRSASRSWQQGVHCKYIQIVIHIQYTYSVYIYAYSMYIYSIHSMCVYTYIYIYTHTRMWLYVYTYTGPSGDAHPKLPAMGITRDHKGDHWGRDQDVLLVQPQHI